MKIESDTAAPDDSEDVARWMKEMGQRKGCTKAPRQISRALHAPTPSVAKLGMPTRFRHCVYLGVLAGAYLQFFFADVFLQIVLVPSVIVFVFTGSFS